MKINFFGLFVFIFLLLLIVPVTATFAEDAPYEEAHLVEQKINVKLINTIGWFVEIRMILGAQEKKVVLLPRTSMDEIFTIYTDPFSPEKIRFQIIAKVKPQKTLLKALETSVYFDGEALEFEGQELIIQTQTPEIGYEHSEYGGTPFASSISVGVDVGFAQPAN